MKPKPLDHSSIDTLLGSFRSNVYYQFRADDLASTSPVWRYWSHDILSLPRDTIRLTMWHHGYGHFFDCDYAHMFSVVCCSGGIQLRPAGGGSGVGGELSLWLQNQESVSSLIHIVEPQRGAGDGTVDKARSRLDENLKGVFS